MGTEDTRTLAIPGLVDVVEIGGSGSLYWARQLVEDRAVAVRIFSCDPGIGGRLRCEHVMRALRALSRHPHVVSVYGSGFALDGRAYVLLELMEEGSLAEWVATDGRLPCSEVLEVAVNIAGALETAHRAGVVHGHLQPKSILVSGSGKPQLAGLDSAVIRHVKAIADGTTPPPVTDDVGGLGATMLTLLTATEPGEEPADVALERCEVPAPVRGLVERCLAEDPAARPTSIEELAEAIQYVQQVLGKMTDMLVDNAAALEARRALRAAIEEPAASSDEESQQAGQEPALAPPEPEAAEPPAETPPAGAEPAPPEPEAAEPPAETPPAEPEPASPEPEAAEPPAEAPPEPEAAELPAEAPPAGAEVPEPAPPEPEAAEPPVETPPAGAEVPEPAAPEPEAAGPPAETPPAEPEPAPPEPEAAEAPPEPEAAEPPAEAPPEPEAAEPPAEAPPAEPEVPEPVAQGPEAHQPALEAPEPSSDGPEIAEPEASRPEPEPRKPAAKPIPAPILVRTHPPHPRLRGRRRLVTGGAVVLLTAVAAAGVRLLGHGAAPQPPEQGETVVVLDQPVANQGVVYTGFRTVTDESGQLSMIVPEEWNFVRSLPLTLDGVEVGVRLEAALGPGDGAPWNRPGAVLAATSKTLAQGRSIEQVLDKLRIDERKCTYEGRRPFDDNLYVGAIDSYTGCGESGAKLEILVATSTNLSRLVIVQVTRLGPRDERARDRVIETFKVNGP